MRARMGVQVCMRLFRVFVCGVREYVLNLGHHDLNEHVSEFHSLVSVVIQRMCLIKR